MPRNIDRRVEVCFPIENPDLRRRIVNDVLMVYLRDTEKAYELKSDGRYIPCSTLVEDGEELFNSQKWFLSQHEGKYVKRDEGRLEFSGRDCERVSKRPMHR